ncbi:MAG TPA: hypothetical protein VGQ13_01615 [Nitrososphaera sp.]|jgi:hypothetical protein|nr:hypothetical protein [Nitrososphaera sp.]
MAAGSSAPQRGRKAHGKAHLWFQRNESRLLAIDIVCVVLLFFLHLFTSTFQTLTPEIISAVQISAIVLVAFIVLSVVWKGIVPLIICVLGIVLMHYSLILPYYSAREQGDVNLGGTRFTYPMFTPTVAGTSANMHFFLGVSTVALSLIIAYRPSLLFARSRPESLDSEWSKYPVWHDNTLLADGRQERSVPVKSLISDQDKYLLWRYEYILANIYGTPYLVRPDGLVPKDSTDVFRDKDSGLLIGKARYSGFFM